MIIRVRLPAGPHDPVLYTAVYLVALLSVHVAGAIAVLSVQRWHK